MANNLVSQKEFKMGIGVGTAIAISAGTSMVTANKQREAQEDALAEQKKLEANAREQEQMILQQQAPQEAQGAEQQTAYFGSQDEEEMASYNDFITPKTTGATSSGLGGTSGSTGLGF